MMDGAGDPIGSDPLLVVDLAIMETTNEVQSARA
jgi:hypothetical protein